MVIILILCVVLLLAFTTSSTSWSSNPIAKSNLVESIHRIKFDGRILMIGFGAVAIATLPALFKHMDIAPNRITIITGDARNEHIANKYGIKHIINPITEKNIQDIRKYLANDDMIINLSVDVDSLELVRIAQDMRCLYIDTCIEPWPGVYHHEDIEVRTNYYDRVKAMEVKFEKRDISARTSTPNKSALLSMGANPGVVSLLLKEGLLQLGKILGSAQDNVVDWAVFAQSLGVKTIQIAEQDTQQARQYIDTSNTFVNTWSVDGFVSEAIYQPAECGYGTHEKDKPDGTMFHGDISKIDELNTKSSLYFNRSGVTVPVKSWSPAGPFRGNMVTHNESISIAEYLSIYEGDKLIYRPTVYYAYRPIDLAYLSLDRLLGCGKQQPYQKILEANEISDGFDELGVLIMGTNTTAGHFTYWYGSRVSIDDIALPHNNATTIQVVAGLLAGISWMIDHPNEGIVEADELDLKYLDIGRPYLGRIFGERTDWNPLKISTMIPGENDDPWQLKNFIVY